MIRGYGDLRRWLFLVVMLMASGGCASLKPAPALPAAGSKPRVVASTANEPAVPADVEPDTTAESSDVEPIELTAAIEPVSEPSVAPIELAAEEAIPLPSPVETAESVNAQPANGELPIPNPLPIDLGTALAVSAGRNPRVSFAQERIREAYASLQAADAAWLPSLRTGFNYNKHEGRIQDVAGKIIDTSRGSIYSGMGAQAVGAGSPAVPGIYMNFQLRDALFNPRIAERTLAAQQRAGQATTNDILLETSLAYLDLLEAVQTSAVADEIADKASTLAELTGSFAKAGQGTEADSDRAQTELAARRIEALRSIENVRVSSARLTRLLSQDQCFTLVPEEPTLTPIDLVDVSSGLCELTAIGLSNRPELAESRYLVDVAVERLRREKAAPLLPSVLLGASYGGNLGGLGGRMTNFGDRFDGDVAAYWEVRNLGLGEQAGRNGAGSRLRQANNQRIQVMDQVAGEIAEAFAQVEVRKLQIETARSAITTAESSYRRNSERIHQGEGLPIETLQSIQALDQARRLYVRTVADYNRAQFRLQRALGWPVFAP
jgi:outer membrane protein TolC